MSAHESKPAGNQHPISTGYQDDGTIGVSGGAPELTIAPFGYLTPQDEFGVVERGNPLPYTLPLDRRREVGLERETWQLEVVADPSSTSLLENPLSKESGTALTFDGLRKLAEQHGVRYLKGMTCLNIGEPLGMGLWEGVPLRDVIWQAQPVRNIRRVFYYGYHNDDPAQVFQSSLPFSRVLEDPPGELPVLLCYKLNGEYLSGQRGGPVRMIVPEAYGFKSVKWLQRVVLTNDYRANDTYHAGNNDIDTPMKTFASFADVPLTVPAGEPFVVRGLAQSGVSGLAKVQYWLHLVDEPLPPDDPYFARAPWRDADIAPPPEQWDGELPAGQISAMPLQFDIQTGTPRVWPPRYTVTRWSAVLDGLTPGHYEVRCRTIDLNGIAQPMPRPFRKSGRVDIHRKEFIVE